MKRHDEMRKKKDKTHIVFVDLFVCSFVCFVVVVKEL